MATIRDVIFDSRHPASIARFWAAAIDDYQVAAYDDAELARLRNLGVLDPEDDPAVLVEPVTGRGPRLFFQFVPEAKIVKNRVHLDLQAADADAEADRLARLGARLLARHEHWITLADPEGNEFCIQQAAATGTTP
jgi:hypothetical protein